MPILIPSKNIYGEIENEKVRNNVIQRIEVNAFETVPANEYDVPIVNVKVKEEEITQNSIFQNNIDKYLQSNTNRVNQNSAVISASYVRVDNKYNYYFDIKIPVVQNNKYVSSLLLGVDKENNPNIKYSVFGVVKKGTATANFPLTSVSTGYLISEGEINCQDPTSTIENQLFDFPKEISHTYDKTIGNTVTAKTNLTDTSTIANITQATLTSDEKYYEIKGQIMCLIRCLYLDGATSWSGYSGLPEPTTLSMNGEYTSYIPTQIEITINGNLIGIDLKEKTLYLPNDDQTSKKVFSVNGNELIQTTNKDENSINAVQKAYLNTYNQYLEGKETAKVRCSISNYYTENDELKVDIKKQDIIVENSNIRIIEMLDGRWYYLYAWSPTIVEEDTYIDVTYFVNNWEQKEQFVILKGEQSSTRISSGQYPSYNMTIIKAYEKRYMAFRNGDKVIPMVLDGATNADRPMSYYKNGYAKVFEVVNVERKYDGAVWQTLDLVEVNYSELPQSTLDSLANFKLKELANRKLQSV